MRRFLPRVCALLLAASFVLSVPVLADGPRRSDQRLRVDGEAVRCEKYRIDGYNYFKLRDLAALLSGTGSQFDVDYDAARNRVLVHTGRAYTHPDGKELSPAPDRSAAAHPTSQALVIDGTEMADLSVWHIGGYNFFRLRELGEALGFGVDYDEPTRTALILTRPVISYARLSALAEQGETDRRGRTSFRRDVDGERGEWSVTRLGEDSLELFIRTTDADGTEGALTLTLTGAGGACPLRFVLRGDGFLLSGAGATDALRASDGAEPVPVRFDPYDGPAELREAAESSAAALLRLLILRLRIELLTEVGNR